MMTKEEKIINEIKTEYQANKLIIVDEIKDIKDINSKEETKEVMLKVLNRIDNDKGNLEAVESFYNFIDNIKDKTYQGSYKDEVLDTLIEFIEARKSSALAELEREYNNKFNSNIDYLEDVVTYMDDKEDTKEVIEAFSNFLMNVGVEITEEEARESIEIGLNKDASNSGFSDLIDAFSKADKVAFMLDSWLLSNKEDYKFLLYGAE
ncbi:hypothetical protein [Sulfurimonas sp.]|uniref:hypothetical protein n=1 Tax=Sulfurimonas sp. TaxID=2022749 RepID=UPI002B494B50|nr:hypothetical protein [Sulfurimonas sp.]